MLKREDQKIESTPEPTELKALFMRVWEAMEAWRSMLIACEARESGPNNLSTSEAQDGRLKSPPPPKRLAIPIKEEPLE